MVRPIDERDVEETLDAVESIWLASLEGNCEIFQLAAHYADLCSGARLPGDADHGGGRVLPGTERSVQLGGQGTPRVAEFAAVEFGARMRMGAVGARHLIADALDARHRLPLHYARVVAGEVRVPWVRYVASRTRELSQEAAAKVDADMVESADGRLPWSRFCARLEGCIAAADPEAAARREEAARREVFAKSTRFSENGMKGFFLRAPVALVVRFEATVAYLAAALQALGDTDDEDERRVKACAVMANPMHAVELLAAFAAHRSRTGTTDDVLQYDESGDDPADDELPTDDRATGTPETMRSDSPETSAGLTPRPFRPQHLPAWLARACDPSTSPVLDWPKLLPRVTVYLHLAEETVNNARAGNAEGVARWEREGPVTLQYVREQLAPYHSFTITPVIDLAGQEPVDCYEIPGRHRRAVRLRTPADCFPFAANLDAVLDIDHNQAYRHAPEQMDGQPGQAQEAGQSRMGNYGPLGRFHHRVKTHGGWLVAQPFDGIYVWRDPHGHFYLVDHTGTRKVTPPPERSRRQKERRKAILIELYRSDVVLDLDGFKSHAA